jgi:S1-C subfamily serine protease
VPEVAEIARPGAASLGLALAQGDGAGPVVDELVGSRPIGVGGAGAERLRYRDVVLAIDGRSVRTLDDLFRIMGEFEVGDVVRVRVRRGTVEQEIAVELVAYDPDTGR